jgi:hypothetical protein
MCGSSDFRTSRLRGEDLRYLFLLHFPVRCRACFRRDHVSLSTWLKIRQASKLRHKEKARE